MPLVTAGSGIAIGLPQNWRASGALAADARPTRCRPSAACARWCRAAARWRPTRRCAHFRRSRAAGAARSTRSRSPPATTWSRRRWPGPTPRLADGPVLVYATAEPDAVKAVQARARRGARRRAGRAALARDRRRAGRARRAPARRGRRRNLGRGGAGAGRAAAARSAPQIDPGVPWTAARSPRAGATCCTSR